MKRKPRRWIVLISACLSPSSPIALRAALIRLLSAASDTIRPFQMRIEQFVLADHTVAMMDQVHQQIIDLRLHVHDFTRAPQFLATQVDLMAGENKAHGYSPSILAVADLGQGCRRATTSWPSKPGHDVWDR